MDSGGTTGRKLATQPPPLYHGELKREQTKTLEAKLKHPIYTDRRK